MSDILVDNLTPEIKRVTLNRPESLNAFKPSMYTELTDKLIALGRDPATRVVVLTGAGRGFCAGHDNVNPAPITWMPEGLGKAQITLHFMAEIRRLLTTLRELPQPVIAAVNGATAGIGYSMALCCDLIVAAKSAKFVNAFHNAANGSEGALSYLLPRAVGMQRAAELLMTARPVLADEAERIGLILKAVPDETLLDEVRAIADQMVQNVPLALWTVKQNLHAAQHVGSFEQAADMDTRAVALINYTDDAQEKRVARKEKRAPSFKSR